ncbi:NUDIX hydrolase [Pontibacillus yanchengensis]|uniref:DNA mismatch repair protein MutT n=1 Tax=Pontibacillus yanchengensis Y32 TaxID=1385514 RepID=A0A0A2TCY3_9BACI|nr:NUDIX domain-containing protein [Pontibacillus yanchengensis]KGP73374.1 DNA mismatch repair protein MutT [Pontibacillus yanchengensis Y32]
MSYIDEMRKYIGHETLVTIGCGVLIEDQGSVLLQRRTDDGFWGIPGGMMEVGETFEETARRETLEETGIEVYNLDLFGLYSGENCLVEYSNKDKVFSVQVIFKTSSFEGELYNNGDESIEQRYFSKEELPIHLNPTQAPFIKDWKNGCKQPVIK